MTRYRLRGSKRLALAGFLALALCACAGLAQAEIVQKGSLRVGFEGQLQPKTLPRSKEAPVTVTVSADVSSTNAQKPPPPLREMAIAINKYGHINTGALPVCSLEQIQPATTDDALAACRRSLVGEGKFTANVLLSGQAPFPNSGKIYAFNGVLNGKPAILAHVYGTQPAPASFTLAFAVGHAKGKFGTTLTAKLPPVKAGAGYITGISLSLGKAFTSHSKRPYITASCPAPKGFGGASFPFAKASVAFQGGQALGATLTRNCKARG